MTGGELWIGIDPSTGNNIPGGLNQPLWGNAGNGLVTMSGGTMNMGVFKARHGHLHGAGASFDGSGSGFTLNMSGGVMNTQGIQFPSGSKVGALDLPVEINLSGTAVMNQTAGTLLGGVLCNATAVDCIADPGANTQEFWPDALDA